jgi:hypothetical protein
MSKIRVKSDACGTASFSGQSRLTCCQRLKRRDLFDVEGTGSLADAYISWAAPAYLTEYEIIDLATICRPRQYPKRLRMHYFDCNAPGAAGYSVATDGVKIITIHAHGLDEVQFYEDVDSSFQFVFWIYMSVDQGEYVTEIRRRYGCNGFRHVRMDSLGLMVRRWQYPVVRKKSNATFAVHNKSGTNHPVRMLIPSGSRRPI